MKQDHYFIFLTAGVLKTELTQVRSFLNWCNDTGPQLSLAQFRVPHKISISAMLLSGEEVSLSRWHERINEDGLEGIYLASFDQSEGRELPDSIASAFTNGIAQGIVVKTKKRIQNFNYFTQQAPPFDVKSLQLFELVEAQPSKSEIWKLLIFEMNDLLDMRKKELIDPQNVRSFFIDRPTFVESCGEEFMTVLQELCHAFGDPLQVPEAFNSVLIEQGANQSTPFDFKSAFNTWVDGPEQPKEMFGTEDLVELKRIFTRSLGNQVRRWKLKPTQSPYIHHLFMEVPPAKFLGEELKVESLDHFILTLQEAVKFCEKISAPFLDIFRAGLWILQSQDYTAKMISNEIINDIDSKFEKFGLNVQTKEVILSHLRHLVVFQKLAFSEIQLRAIVASSLCDVFGGMGSWNDMYMETEADEQTYRKISNDLLSSIREARAFAVTNK